MKRISLSCLECSTFYLNGGFGDSVTSPPFKKNNNNLFKHSTNLNLHADEYYNLMLHISYEHNVTVFWHGLLKGTLNLGLLACDPWLGAADLLIFAYISNKSTVSYPYVLRIIFHKVLPRKNQKVSSVCITRHFPLCILQASRSHTYSYSKTYRCSVTLCFTI